MGNKPLSVQDCTNGDKVEKYAIHKGLNVRNGKGDHAIIKYNENEIVFCRREMGKGLACKIFKWFKTMGLLVFLGIPFYIFLNSDKIQGIQELFK